MSRCCILSWRPRVRLCPWCGAGRYGRFPSAGYLEYQGALFLLRHEGLEVFGCLPSDPLENLGECGNDFKRSSPSTVTTKGSLSAEPTYRLFSKSRIVTESGYPAGFNGFGKAAWMVPLSRLSCLLATKNGCKLVREWSGSLLRYCIQGPKGCVIRRRRRRGNPDR